mmetsp:Transcript_129173/g.275531  ORF Transcript_129173/g.275531 Transcript_129173/m.275531 type:complete len:820 (-) Transcript_129173:99-2558(-)
MQTATPSGATDGKKKKVGERFRKILGWKVHPEITDCVSVAVEAFRQTRFPGKPQIDGQGIPRYAEFWGFSRAQCQQLLNDLHDDPYWNVETNMYTFVNEYVKRWTQGTGMGLALLKNKAKPLKVNKMVSHCWAENVEEFLREIIKASADDDVMFICAFSIYQCEDGAGPSIEEQIGTIPAETPFGRVLSNVKIVNGNSEWHALRQKALRGTPSLLAMLSMLLFFAYPIWSSRLPKLDGQCHGLLLNYRGRNMNGNMDPPLHFEFDRCMGNVTAGTAACVKYVKEECPAIAWPLQIGGLTLAVVAVILKVLQIAFHKYGSMLVVPTRATDIYTRLWCVYEIYFASVVMGIDVEMARNLAVCGTCSAGVAHCSNEGDRRRIHAQIVESGGFDQVDKAVRQVTRQCSRKVWWEFVRVFVTGSIGLPGALQLTGFFPSGAFGAFCAWLVSCLYVYAVFTKLILPTRGVLTKKQFVCAFVGLPIGVAICTPILLVFQLVSLFESPHDNQNAIEFIGGVVIVQELFCLFMLFGVSAFKIVQANQTWAHHHYCNIVNAIFMTNAVVYVFLAIPGCGTHFGNFGELIPLHDRLIACLSMSVAGFIFFVYIPRMLVTFNVHVPMPLPSEEEKSRLHKINPAKGERLVYPWHRRLYRWVPMPAVPPSLDGKHVPPELAACGLDDIAWQAWIDRLTLVKQSAWQDPRMWLWTGLHAFVFAVCTINTLAGLAIAILFVFFPTHLLNRYQTGLRQWLRDFNEVLAPMGVLVKAQTVKKAESETSYLSFALTSKESAILRDEPIFVPGQCLNVQTDGDRNEFGNHPFDRGRVV